MGSVIPTGKGAGRGGARPGAGRKPASAHVPAVEPELVPEPFQVESKAAKKERAESFRRYARERTLDEIATLSDEIFKSGSRAERAAWLMFLSSQGYGSAPKAAIQNVSEEGKTVTDLLGEIAARKTEEERQKLLPPAPQSNPPSGT